MRRVNVVCEGRTEELFVGRVLGSYLLPKGLILTPRNIRTGTSYGRLKFNLIQWLKEEGQAIVTMMIDLYGMNHKFPGKALSQGSPAQKAAAIERAIEADIAQAVAHQGRFIPYVQLHEFEALLFSGPDIMEEWLSQDIALHRGTFRAIREAFSSPEDINDQPHSAPSRRILDHVPSYSKTNDGPAIADLIGIDQMRQACPHFDQWVQKLEAWA